MANWNSLRPSGHLIFLVAIAIAIRPKMAKLAANTAIWQPWYRYTQIATYCDRATLSPCHIDFYECYECYEQIIRRQILTGFKTFSRIKFDHTNATLRMVL